VSLLFLAGMNLFYVRMITDEPAVLTEVLFLFDSVFLKQKKEAKEQVIYLFSYI